MARPSVQSTAAQAGSTTLVDRADAGGAGRGIAVGTQPHVFGALAQQQVDRRQHDEHQEAHGPARRAPAGAFDDELHRGQQHDGADTHAGKGNAGRQSAPAHEPVGQEQRLAGIAEADAAAADQYAQRGVEMPGLSW